MKFIFSKEEKPLNEFDDFIKKTILRTAKTIYIADCNRITSYINETNDDVLFNYHSDYKEMSKDLGEEFALEFFESMRKHESRNF